MMNEEEKRKSFLSIFEDLNSQDQNGHVYPGLGEEEQGFSLTDEMDHEILMHRDTHFGGDFQVMLDYYQDNKLGVNADFEIERIVYLAQVEQELGQDLSALVLSGPEAERVSRARRAYERLKAIYIIEESKNPFPRLIADLILSEEEEPDNEIEAIVAQGTRIIPELIYIINSDEAYDPLFPGYGFAPYLAIICLGKIGDPKTVIPLFETLGRETIFEEEVILEALAEIGKPAQDFLIKTLKSRPLGKDNLNAAFALSAFSKDPDVAIACFEELQDEIVMRHPLLRTYLLCNCEALKETSFRDSFVKMAENPDLPIEMRTEITQMIHSW